MSLLVVGWSKLCVVTARKAALLSICASTRFLEGKKWQESPAKKPLPARLRLVSYRPLAPTRLSTRYGAGSIRYLAARTSPWGCMWLLWNCRGASLRRK